MALNKSKHAKNLVYITSHFINRFWIPKSLNMNLSHQLFDYKINFVDFSTHTHQFKKLFCCQKYVLIACLKISNI